jgi:hypothetical protein
MVSFSQQCPEGKRVGVIDTFGKLRLHGFGATRADMLFDALG